MPNPLMGALPLKVSKEPPKGKRAIPPVPEEYAGYNNPYRGTEMHGVDPTGDPREVPGHESGRDVVYDPPLPEPDPIPVVIRQTGGRELRRSRIFRAFAKAGTATQIVGRDEARYKVQLKNLGASDVYIGDRDDTANASHGWTLAQNDVYKSETQDTLYAMSSHATDGMYVAVSVEYTAVL